MKTNKILLIGAAAVIAYLLLKNSQVGALKRGYYTRQEPPTGKGCHKNEVRNYIKRAV